jgi:hypothetical protein
MAGCERGISRETHDLAQTAAHAIPYDCIADLPGHRETDADDTFPIGADAGLQHERARRRPCPRGSSPKICPALQPLHGNSIGNDIGNALRSDPADDLITH